MVLDSGDLSSCQKEMYVLEKFNAQILMSKCLFFGAFLSPLEVSILDGKVPPASLNLSPAVIGSVTSFLFKHGQVLPAK